MDKLSLGSAAAVALLTAPAAFADRGRRSDVEYAHVMSAVPVYRSVRVEEPRRECRDQRFAYQDRDAYWMGNSAGQRVAVRHTPPVPEYAGHERRCSTLHETRYEERIEGYDVAYRYNGRVYHARMPYDPGDRIAIRVEVRAVDSPWDD